MAEPMVPSRAALVAAEEANRAAGHENGGFVSSAHGFVPVGEPALSLPPSHAAWDDLAERLPELYRNVRVRPAIAALPVLDASEDALADEHLLRAVTLLSILAHAWVRIENSDAGEIPPAVLEPWTQVCRRLGRSEAFMQYNDLILTNWRVRAGHSRGGMDIEDLELLVPTVGNQTEQVFYLTQIEMTAKAAPLVEAVVRAQEAIAADDAAGVKEQLLVMLDVVRALVERSFVKIDPNPLAATHCDPVIWGTTVGPFGVSLHPHVPGPGGTANPVFHLVDSFLGRHEYGSQLGEEAHRLHAVAPPLQRQFIDAVRQTSLTEFVARARSRSLSGLVETVLDAYAGDQGIITAHRIKAYGFLEVAFKVGRSMTLGGFQGLFRDRPWKQVDSELEITRLERDVAALRQVHRAAVAERTNPAAADDGSVARVSLDIAERGVAYRAGDRCGVLAENDPALVDRVLAVLGASPDDVVPLTPSWVKVLKARPGFEAATELRLGDFLRFAKLRPVLRDTAKALLAVSVSPRLAQVVEARTEDQWELWDLLQLVHDDGYDVSRLVTSEAWQEEALAYVVPPEPFRMYSVSSAPDLGEDGLPRTLDLTVGSLRYESQGQGRTGTASSFLIDRADDAAIRIVHPRSFRLPDDPARPIVMFAAGTGIAPFRGFLQTPRTGEAWLFVAARDRGHLLYEDELASVPRLHMRTALSSEQRLEQVMEADDNAEALWSLMTEQDGVFYVCGRPGFASDVLESLVRIARTRVADENAARRVIRQLVADRRLMMDIFTAFAPVTAQRREDAGAHDASEVVLRNDDEHGYWIVVDGMVYDMTEFVHLHPGGKKIIVESAGIDASREYRAVLHHQNSEIDAMLSMYKIGAVRRLRFGGEWGIVLTPDGFQYLSLHDAYRTWVRALYLVVEMQNALNNDFSYMALPTVMGETGEELTPLKLMLFGNTHLRFFDHYFHGSLGEDLQLLWSITAGMCANEQPLKRLSSALDEVLSSDDAKTVERFGARLHGLYQEGSERVDDAGFWDMVRGLAAAVEAADRGFLTAMKMALREGVMVFERLEADTLRSGGPALVDALLAVPGVAAAYYRDLIARVQAVAPALLA